jgi:hypothetical protein
MNNLQRKKGRKNYADIRKRNRQDEEGSRERITGY